MKRKRIFAAAVTVFILFCLFGCGEQIKEQVPDKVKEEVKKHCFENETEAERYLVDSLGERYGVRFMIVERQSYEKSNSIYGDVYVAKAAPSSNPEQTFFGRVEQTGAVSDDYWKIIFRETLESEPRAACAGWDDKSYAVKLEGELTERAWKPEDDLGELLETAQLTIRIDLVLEEGRSEEDYADAILHFLENLWLFHQPKADFSLGVRTGDAKEYLFFETFAIDEGYTRLPREELIKNIKKENFHG